MFKHSQTNILLLHVSLVRASISFLLVHILVDCVSVCVCSVEFRLCIQDIFYTRVLTAFLWVIVKRSVLRVNFIEKQIQHRRRDEMKSTQRIDSFRSSSFGNSSLFLSLVSLSASSLVCLSKYVNAS